MEFSGADGVMIGRGAYGRPWWPGHIAECLKANSGKAAPTLAMALGILLKQQDDTLELYGSMLGNKTFRKHLGWTIVRLKECGAIDEATQTRLRASLLSEKSNERVATAMRVLFADCVQQESLAA